MSKELIHISTAGILLVALIFLNVSGAAGKIIDPLRSFVDILSRPLVKLFEKFENFLQLTFGLRGLVRQNEILTRQVEELTSQIAVLERSKIENKFLREALVFFRETKLELIPTEVLAFDILNVSQTVAIDRGKNDGVEVGDALIAAHGILVAVVSEVFDSTSEARLLTSSAVSVNAEVLPGGATGIVRGEHGLGLLFDLISQNEEIKTGDRVVTSGLGAGFPKNLLIGQIGEVDSGGPELFQKASILPAADLRHNKIIFVVKE